MICERSLQITSDELNQEDPVIYRDIVVYEATGGEYNNIHFYNLINKKEFQMIPDSDTSSSECHFPGIYGSVIVWREGGERIGGICGYNIVMDKEFAAYYTVVLITAKS